MSAIDSKCWRFWMACESEQSASQFAGWMKLHYGGSVSRRPTLRFRNVRYAGSVLVFDVTYIARGANMTDINRVLAKMCFHYGGGWYESFHDLMYVTLRSWPYYFDMSTEELVHTSNRDYDRAVEQHHDVMRFMGGLPEAN